MKTKFTVGQSVRPNITTEAYYSGYGNNPTVMITPDMVGVVAAVNVPSVRYVKGKPHTFHCVDFTLPDTFAGDPKHGNNVWRASFYENQLTIA
jgi:hypothetical protein